MVALRSYDSSVIRIRRPGAIQQVRVAPDYIKNDSEIRYAELDLDNDRFVRYVVSSVIDIVAR